jgi:hypothetical protein
MNLTFKNFLVLALATTLAGCSKDDDATSQPPASTTTGTVTGSVSPANGASRVLLISGADTLKATPSGFGEYTFEEVKPGPYQVMAKPFPDHEAPAPVAVSVSAGQTTTVPVITLTRVPIDGLISVSVDGSVISGTPLFSAVGNGSISISNSTMAIYLELPEITKTGTYTNANSDLSVIVLQGPNTDRWETTKTTGTATLTVTAFDPVTLKGSATFSFSAPASGNGATGNKVGTNGSLKNARLAR